MEENTSKVYLEPANALLSQASGAGSPLFVINLCASMAPATLTGKSLPGLDSYRLYQVSRVEDGRTRYRLRLGFFTTQDAANRVLETVRQQYATAFTASLSDEDRRFTRGYVPDVSATGRMRVRPAVAVVPQTPPPVAASKQPVKQAPPQVAARAATPASAKPAPAAPAARVAAPATAPKLAAPSPAANAPQAKSAKTSESGVYETTWEPQRAAATPAKTSTTGSYKALNPSALATGSFKAADKAAATGSFRRLEPKALATGAFRVADQKAATGSFRALDPKVAATGTHKALEQKALATGAHKAFEQKAAATGMHKALEQKAAATGSHRALEQKAVATGMHKALEQKAAATGSHRALEQKAAATGSHRALGQKTAATGSFKALDQSAINEIEISWNKPAAKVPHASAPAHAAARPVAPKAAAPAATKSAAALVPPKAPPILRPEPAVQAKPATKTAPPVVKAPPAPAAKTPARVPEVKNPPVTVKPSAPMKLELEAAPVAASRPAAHATPSNQPFHVGKGVNIPQVSLSLETGKHSRFTPAAAPVAAKAPATPANKAPVPPKPAAQQPAASVKPGAVQLPPRMTGLPDLDSTQTIRALSDEEMNDAHQEKWWAIQLAVSDQPLNLDAMPHLDIFEAYRLYSVAGAANGKILHSLRLGFFREAVSAEAVSGYLKTFFPTPSVLRISTAEQARFKDAPASKSPPKAESKVIDLNNARDRVKPVIPMVTMEVPDRSPTGTFKPGAAAFKNGNSGTYKALSPAFKPAQAPVGKPAAARPAVAKRPPAGKLAGSKTGKYRVQPKGSLQEQLLDAAREVELSESGIRRLPKSDSLLARLVDRLKK